MKKIKLVLGLSLLGLITLFLPACDEAGKTNQRLQGNEQHLPPELKGLKIYSVSIGEGKSVKVALFENQVNSTTYVEGKTQQTLLLVNKVTQKTRTIPITEILLENDSFIICRKIPSTSVQIN